MSRVFRSASAAALVTGLSAVLLCAPLGAALPPSSAADGWYTWRVAAVDEAPSWCCLSWSGGRATPTACNLDKDHANFGNGNDDLPHTGQMQIYARLVANAATQIRVLSPACPVDSADVIRDLGVTEPDASFRWLRGYSTTLSERRNDALAAIAVHRGDAALEFLIEAATGGSETGLRKDAIFWLAQVRIAQSEPTVTGLMFDDANAEIREHAAFSLSQSSSPTRAAALIRQGRADRDAGVRSRAWLWLAQTGAPQSEQEIGRAIVSDPSAQVREEAVFALAQLPDDRAVASLLGILEDLSRDRKIRKQALFWLVQSDSGLAYESVERLLSDQGRTSTSD